MSIDLTTNPSDAAANPEPLSNPLTAAPPSHADGIARHLIALLRLSIGWVFLWAFVDKLFGLGFATESDAAWVQGGSPTNGFLSFGTKGPFADFFQSFAGAAWADWLFMVGLLGIGIGLVLGIGVRLSAFFGGVLLVLMWAAALAPEHNPFMDDHLVYAIALGLVAVADAGTTWGFGQRWQQQDIVQRYPVLV